MRPATAARCAGPCRSGRGAASWPRRRSARRRASAIGISPTTPENRTRISSIQMPEKIDAQRVRPPAATFSAVWPTEPPTGWPRNSPEAMFPIPCAMKSRFGSDRDPPGFGAASATPVPWTSTITATAAAAAIRSSDESSDSCGRCGVGMPLGILPESSTRTRLLAPSVSSCRDRQRYQRGDRGDPRATQHDHQQERRYTHRRRGQRHLAWMGDDVPGLDHRRLARLRGAEQVGELAEHDVDGDAGEESGQHRHRDKAREAPPAQHPRERSSSRRPAPTARTAPRGGRRRRSRSAPSRRRAPQRLWWSPPSAAC